MQKERQQQLENELAQEKLHCLEVCIYTYQILQTAVLTGNIVFD